MRVINCLEKSYSCQRAVGFLVVLLLATTAVAESVSMYTTNGTDGVTGYVTGPSTGSFGGTYMNLKNTGLPVDSFDRKGYIRMDISSKSFTARTAYLDIILTLTDSLYGSNPQTVNIYGMTDETLDSWSTNTTTWANAPGNDAASPSDVDPAKTVLLGTITISNDAVGKVKRLASAALVDFLNADTNGKVTFILCRPYSTYSNRNLGFSGDTHATYLPPKLTISSDITSLTGADGTDGFVMGNNTGGFNNGSINLKNVDDPTSSYTRKGYTRMDISSIDFTVGAAYVKFVITAVDTYNSTPYAGINQVLKVYGLTDESLDDWDPSSTTWNNAPGNDTASCYAGDTNKTVYLGDLTVPYNSAVGDTVSFSSGDLADFLNADSNGKVTFIIGRYNSAAQQGDENLVLAGGANTTYDPPKLEAYPTISGTIQVGDDMGYFPSGGWHVKNAGIENAVTRKGYVRFGLTGVDYTIGSAQLDITLALVDEIHNYFNNDQVIKVYGLTDQSLDNWNYSTTTWSTAPGNDTNSAYAADLTKAVYLGDITVTPSDVAGNMKSLKNQNLVSFLNADTNGLVTFIFGRYTGLNNGGGENLLFAGEVSTVYAGPSLTFDRPKGTVILIQ